MPGAESPLLISIVGRKNSGKTTLLVRVAAELRLRGFRVASVKHGHHEIEIDQPGRDSWRHVHEGGVEAVLLLSTGRVAMIMNRPGEELDVHEMVDRHLGDRGYDFVLVEGFKYGDLPKIEIHRRDVHPRPIYDQADAAAAALFLAIVTDDPHVTARCPVLRLPPLGPEEPHVHLVADLLAGLLSDRTGNG